MPKDDRVVLMKLNGDPQEEIASVDAAIRFLHIYAKKSDVIEISIANDDGEFPEL